MKLVMEIVNERDVKKLEDFWNQMIDEEDKEIQEINESGNSEENEPTIFKSESISGNKYEYVYDTFSDKGEYRLNVEKKTIVFEGWRNSFGNTKFFSIEKEGEMLILSSKDYKADNEQKRIQLKVKEYETSKKEKPFWATAEKKVLNRGEFDRRIRDIMVERLVKEEDKNKVFFFIEQIIDIALYWENDMFDIFEQIFKDDKKLEKFMKKCELK